MGRASWIYEKSLAVRPQQEILLITDPDLDYLGVLRSHTRLRHLNLPHRRDALFAFDQSPFSLRVQLEISYELGISYLGVAPLETFRLSLVSGTNAVGLNLPELAQNDFISFCAPAAIVFCIHTVTRDILSAFYRAGRPVFTARHSNSPLAAPRRRGRSYTNFGVWSPDKKEHLSY